MRILIYSDTTAEKVAASLGQPEYSYYFVLKAFRPLLESIGSVTLIQDPYAEADVLYEQSLQSGESCILLSFSPPHKTPIGLRCPCISVFAWEFNTLPAEPWGDDERDNWHVVLNRLGGAITHSRFMANVVRGELGAGFPIISIPAPMWDRYAEMEPIRRNIARCRELHISGVVIDTRVFDLTPFDPRRRMQPTNEPAADPVRPLILPGRGVRARLRITQRHAQEWYRLVLADKMPLSVARAVRTLLGRPAQSDSQQQVCPPLSEVVTLREMPSIVPEAVTRHAQWQNAEVDLELSGVVYTSVLNPYDGRKNWFDMICAFCWALRDAEDATLVLKLTHYDIDYALEAILENLFKLQPFRCRIILIHGFLSDENYARLVAATTYIVNTSHGEGQCLPLMEFMSSGCPAIAPCNTALEDYIDSSVAFIARSTLEPTHWPHDPRQTYRTLRYRTDWESVVKAYENSYQTVKYEPERYQLMADNARVRLREHCSYAVLRGPLEQFMRSFFAARSLNLQEESACSGDG